MSERLEGNSKIGWSIRSNLPCLYTLIHPIFYINQSDELIFSDWLFIFTPTP